jgi:hypothetical protein
VGQAAPDEHELLRALRDEHGLDLAGVTRTETGESGAAFWVTDRDGLVSLLKLLPGPAAAGLGWWHELAGTLGRLRDRGYPAPRLLTIGQLGGRPFWIQERMAGAALAGTAGQPEGALIGRLLPELLRLNDAQAGLGTGDRRAWPELIAATLAEGGDGYCVHATLADHAGTRDMLETVRRIGATCAAAVLRPRRGPRPAVGAAARAGRPGRGAGLPGHMVLRQVDWSLRFHPAAAATGQHLRLARRVVADIG